MDAALTDVILKRLEQPDETRTGTVYDLTAGTLFYIPAEPHDSWVVGDEPYVSLHFSGAADYARK